MSLLPLLLPLLLAPARAYETDPYTFREIPIDDATPAANAEANRILALAIERTNARTGCRADDRTTRQVLAREIEKQTDPDQHLWRRGLVAGFGFSQFSYFLETDPSVPLRILPRNYNIYADVTLWENWSQYLVDTCGVVRMGDVFVGTDKFDHFWDIGWMYYDRSEDGTRPDQMVRYALWTESNYRGYGTSRVVSYADLRANWDGYQFYLGLLTEGSVARRGDDGCVVQVRPFDFAAYVDRDWDEFLNVSTYARGLQKGVDRWLERHGENICALDEAARALPPGRVPFDVYVPLDALQALTGKIPRPYTWRQDPFRRAERCPEAFAPVDGTPP